MAKSFNKVLVLGGAGFIGSHLVHQLIDKGYQVTVIDNLSRGNLGFLKGVEDQFRFINKDLRKEDGLLALFEGHDLVFNLAALNTGVDYDEGRTQIMFEENMLLQMIPLRVAAKTQSIKRFIQLSSAVVYSRKVMHEVAYINEDEDTSNPEESKLGYALAKKMGENLAIWYAENSKLETVITRFNNVYGENDHYDELGHFIPVMVRKFIRAKDKVQVFGSGQQSRSFVYVGDVIEALLLLAEKGKNGEIYNVDSNHEKKIALVVEQIRTYLGRDDLELNFDLNKPEGSKRRMLDASKLKALGWQAKVAFDEGLERTIDDIRQRIESEKT